jgi:hypothetical protein
VQVKVWRCLKDVRPIELQQTISENEKQEQGEFKETELMPVIAKDHIKKLTSQQRRRWSQHRRVQREKAKAKQQLNEQKSKDKLVQRAEKIKANSNGKARACQTSLQRLETSLGADQYSR